MNATLLTLALLSGAATVGYAGLCAYAAHRCTRARRKLPALHPDHADLAPAEVEFAARDGRARIAAWYLPGEPLGAAVIFVHGRDACRGDALKAPTLELAEQLNRYGLSVLMLDLRGHGRSGAARLSYGVRESEDVLGAVDYLLGLGHPAGQIGVLGASLGGVAGLLAAVREPALGAVVADSAYADFDALMTAQFARQTRLPRAVLPGALVVARWLTGVDLRRLRPVADVTALRGRAVLVVHGQHDPLVPVAHGEALAQACGARQWITSSSTHVGSCHDQPHTYAAIMLRFFTRHLLGEQQASHLVVDVGPRLEAPGDDAATGRSLPRQALAAAAGAA